MTEKKDKILFLNPPQSCRISERYNNLKFPLGFLYLAGNLEKNSFKVKILDCPLYYQKRKIINKKTAKIGLSPEEIEEEIRKFNPDIIGISCAYTAFESDSFEVIDLIRELEKKLDKKILIVVGGAHTSSNPGYVLRNTNIDIAVIGEGEETMLEIAKNYQRGKNLNGIKGTAIKDKGKLKINPPREYIQNLDDYQPAWHLLDMNLYFKHPDNSVATMRAPSVDLITSRGCPGNCVFCSIHNVWGRKWRGRSAENVVNEIELLYKKYNVKQFRIQDDNLTLDKKRIIKICDLIIEKDLDIRWDTPNGVAFWTLDEEVIKKMTRAGCYRITFGIESGCKNSQKYVRKIIDNKKIKNLINTCHKNGIWVCSTFIIGFPYETKKDILQTKRFISNLNINLPFVYVAQPLLGTDLYRDFKKEGLLKELKSGSSVGESEYDTIYLTSEELNKFRRKIYNQFYIKRLLSYCNPIVLYKEILLKMKTLENFKYTFKSFYALFDKFFLQKSL